MDYTEFDAWLKDRPHTDAIIIAQRAALRVFPLLGAEVGKKVVIEWGVSTLLSLRCILVGGVGQAYNTEELQAAARSACNAVATFVGPSFALSEAALAAQDAAEAVSSAFAYGAQSSAIRGVIAAQSALPNLRWAEMLEDMQWLEDGVRSHHPALWRSSEPEMLRGPIEEMLGNLTTETGDSNSFWHRWWFAAKYGKPLDWDCSARSR